MDTFPDSLRQLVFPTFYLSDDNFSNQICVFLSMNIFIFHHLSGVWQVWCMAGLVYGRSDDKQSMCAILFSLFLFFMTLFRQKLQIYPRKLAINLSKIMCSL